jgi:sterol carrier protein 2
LYGHKHRISGKGGEIVDRNDNTYGGRWVVNPSGGLEAKGHPIGATGLHTPYPQPTSHHDQLTGVSQCVELCKQLRGIANKRQVPNCRVALQHNIGIGGAGYMAMYK